MNRHPFKLSTVTLDNPGRLKANWHMLRGAYRQLPAGLGPKAVAVAVGFVVAVALVGRFVPALAGGGNFGMVLLGSMAGMLVMTASVFAGRYVYLNNGLPHDYDDDDQGYEDELNLDIGEEAADEPVGDRFFTASRAVLIGHEALSCINPNGYELDPRLGCLEAAKDLADGERMNVMVVARRDPNFQQRALDHLAELKGDDSRRQRTGSEKAVRAGGTAARSGLKAGAVLLDGVGMVVGAGDGGRRHNVSVRQVQDALATPARRPQDPEEDAYLKDVEWKAAWKSCWRVAIYIELSGPASSAGRLMQVRKQAAQELSRTFTGPAGGTFAWEDCDPELALTLYMDPRGEGDIPMVAQELAELTRPFDATTEVQNVQVQRQVLRDRPPVNYWSTPEAGQVLLPDKPREHQAVIPLGTYRPGTPQEVHVVTPNAKLDVHGVIMGGTGSGKSELLKRWVLACAKDPVRNAIVVCDPNRKLVEDLLNMLLEQAPERAADIRWWDLGDEDHPLAFNPLHIRSRRELGGMMAGLNAFFSSEVMEMNNAPLARRYALAACRALAEAGLKFPDYAKPSLLQVPEFLTNPDFRAHIMAAGVEGLGAQTAFGPHGDYTRMSEKEQAAKVGTVLQRFASMLDNDRLVLGFGSPVNRVNVFDSVLEGHIVLIHTDALAADPLVGQMMTLHALTQAIAASQVAGARGIRTRVFLDEVAEVLDGVPPKVVKWILKQGRKYKCGVVPAGQEPADLGDLEPIVMNNAYTKVVLKMNHPKAAKGMVESMSKNSDLSADEVAAIPNFWGVAQGELPDGRIIGPYTRKSPLPIPHRPGPSSEGGAWTEAAEEVVARSRKELCWEADELWPVVRRHKQTIMGLELSTLPAAERRDAKQEARCDGVPDLGAELGMASSYDDDFFG